MLQEDPEANLLDFTAYETMPRRKSWSLISEEQYDIVKQMFAQRGVMISSDSPKEDIMEFKDTLLGLRLYLF